MPFDAISSPTDSPKSRRTGATVIAAKKPYTTVGMLQEFQVLASQMLLHLFAYSARYIADIKPIGTAITIATREMKWFQQIEELRQNFQMNPLDPL